jgi:hypothetical protein
MEDKSLAKDQALSRDLRTRMAGPISWIRAHATQSQAHVTQPHFDAWWDVHSAGLVLGLTTETEVNTNERLTETSSLT